MIRVLVAFVVAPITPGILAAMVDRWFGYGQSWSFLLGVGATAGYGFAGVLGLPAYILYFRRQENVRFKNFLLFSGMCILTMHVALGAIMVAQDGVLALLSATLWGYTSAFAVATLVSVSTFYLIVFSGTRSDP